MDTSYHLHYRELIYPYTKDTQYPYPSSNFSFAEKDMVHILKKLNTMKTLYVIKKIWINEESRHMKRGSHLLFNFCEQHADDVIMVVAGLLIDDFPIEPDEFQTQETLAKLTKFYETNGFIDVNRYIGGYEDQCVFLRYNDAGKLVFNHINK